MNHVNRLPFHRRLSAVFACVSILLLPHWQVTADELKKPRSAKKELRNAEKIKSRPDKEERKELKREWRVANGKSEKYADKFVPKLKAVKASVVAVADNGVVNRTPYTPANPWRQQDGERMTVDLPPRYSELDTDFDGQVGLYEWIVARRESMEQFDEIDTDLDGLLTPRELKEFDDANSGKAESSSSTNKYERPRLVIVGGRYASAAGGGGNRKPFMSKEDRQKQEAVGVKIFPHVDKDKDGRISVAELQASKKLTAMFDQAGIRIQDMSEKDFAQRYADVIDYYAEQKSKAREKGQGGTSR